MAWSRMIRDNELPPIVIPTASLVQTYALPVVYYTAGWTLSRASIARTIPKRKRGPYIEFALRHSITPAVAKELNLPTELVDQRKRNSMFRASREYFDFICKVESIYFANLNLSNMIAFADGSLVDSIHQAILKDESVLSAFGVLCAGMSQISEKKEEKNLLCFVMLRFVRSRGRCFLKTMRAEQGKPLAVLDKAATRNKVARKAACSKAAAEARAEKIGNTAAVAAAGSRRCVDEGMQSVYEEAAENIRNLPPDDYDSDLDDTVSSGGKRKHREDDDEDSVIDDEDDGE